MAIVRKRVVAAKSAGNKPLALAKRKPSAEIAPMLSSEERQLLRRVSATLLTAAQVDGSVSITCSENKAVDLALQQEPSDFLTNSRLLMPMTTLVPVIVGLCNAVMTTFSFAAKGVCERRDIELNTAFKGAGVLADLLQAYDAHCGHGNRRVSVGSVKSRPVRRPSWGTSTHRRHEMTRAPRLQQSSRRNASPAPPRVRYPLTTHRRNTATHRRNTAPMLSSPRCGARTRSGAPCRSPAVNGKERCRMHGGAE
jgi:hypothetical protein